MIEPVVIGNATLYHGDCREVMPTLQPVDAVITDPPYGTTRCAWDVVIPFDVMWRLLHPLAGARVPVLLFGSEPFSSLLRTSNMRQFKYDHVWKKTKPTGFLNAKKQPLRAHEIISVFCNGRAPYFPQMTGGHERKTTFRASHLRTEVYGSMAGDVAYDSTERYPKSVVTFPSDTQTSAEHPTQKPVALMQYLIRTHTKPGDVVLDFTMGSGTTGVACGIEGRRFIGIEDKAVHFATACRRIEDAQRQGRLIA